jgi:hypothetical protein
VNRLVILDHKLGVAEREWAENPTLYQRELAQETAMYPPWLLGWEIPERRTGMSVAIRYVSPEEINALGFVHVKSDVQPKNLQKVIAQLSQVLALLCELDSIPRSAPHFA